MFPTISQAFKMMQASERVGSKVHLPATEEAKACMSSIGHLEPAQVFRLQTAVAEPMQLRAGTFISARWPVIEMRPLQFAQEIVVELENRGVQVKDVRLEGNAVAACMDPAKSCTDLELVFCLAEVERRDLYTSREVLLDCLCQYLPKSLVDRERHMIAAAYVQKMMITPPQIQRSDEAWASFTLPGVSNSKSLHCKFAQVLARPQQLDEYGVQIILTDDQLQCFVAAQESGSRIEASKLPDLAFECLVGTPRDAVDLLTPAGASRRKSRKPLNPLQRPNFALAEERAQPHANGYMGKMCELVNGCAQVMSCACLCKGASPSTSSSTTELQTQDVSSVEVDQQELDSHVIAAEERDVTESPL
eukprot:m.358825 g.358825  ORF g.358825 m.358825 type:complete len:362 (-) comp18305_c0_seq1:501-1586(-)